MIAGRRLSRCRLHSAKQHRDDQEKRSGRQTHGRPPPASRPRCRPPRPPDTFASQLSSLGQANAGHHWVPRWRSRRGDPVGRCLQERRACWPICCISAPHWLTPLFGSPTGARSASRGSSGRLGSACRRPAPGTADCSVTPTCGGGDARFRRKLSASADMPTPAVAGRSAARPPQWKHHRRRQLGSLAGGQVAWAALGDCPRAQAGMFNPDAAPISTFMPSLETGAGSLKITSITAPVAQKKPQTQ
jgi:hypothetical protein